MGCISLILEQIIICKGFVRTLGRLNQFSWHAKNIKKFDDMELKGVMDITFIFTLYINKMTQLFKANPKSMT